MPGRGGLGCFGGCLTKLLLVLVAETPVVWAVGVVLNPWALHIGRRSTPLLYWHGTGTVHAEDGKAYPLYVMFMPKTPGRTRGWRQGRGADWSSYLMGRGWLCVAPGMPERIELTGTKYGGYASAANSIFEFHLLEWPNLFVTNNSNGGFFDVAGMWRGNELVMDEPTSRGCRSSRSRLFITRR